MRRLPSVQSLSPALVGVLRLKFALMREYGMTEEEARNLPLFEAYLRLPEHLPRRAARGVASLGSEIEAEWAAASQRMEPEITGGYP